jgi:hypothetical protein
MAHIWNNEPLGGQLSGPLPPSYSLEDNSMPQPTHSLLFRDYFPPSEKLSAIRLNAVKKTVPIWFSGLCQILEIRLRISKDLPETHSLRQKPDSLTIPDSIKHQLASPVQRPKEAAITHSYTAMDFKYVVSFQSFNFPPFRLFTFCCHLFPKHSITPTFHVWRRHEPRTS